MSTQPNFNVSDSAKREEGWYHNAIDWLISKAISSNDKAKTREAMRVAVGRIDTTEFKEVMQPFGNAPEELKNLPGEIRTVDFITPIREKNMGEYIALPYKYFVTVENPDTIMTRDADVAEEVFKDIQQALVDYVTSIQQGQNPQQIDPSIIKDKADKRKQEFFDDKVIQAQHVLDFINKFNDFEHDRINAFSDWWMTEEVYTYRYIQNGELVKELLDVANCYPIPNNNEFVEDYEGFVYRQRITFQEFEQHYADKLTKTEREYLKNFKYDSALGSYTVPITIMDTRGAFDNINYYAGNTSNYLLTGESMDLWRIHFVAQCPVWELKYTDQMGKVQTMHVDSKYELNTEYGDIEIKKISIPKVYEAYRFGNYNEGVYVAPEPCTVQRYDPQLGTVKLPVGGKKGLLRGIPLNPIPLRLKDFLIVDRILLLAAERAVAQYRPDILAIPQAILNPDKAGTTTEKYQHILADNMLIYDDTKVDVNLVTQGLRAIGRTDTAQYIEMLWRLRALNKQDAWEVSNMNQERLGNASAQSTATGTQNNLAYAKLGSILMVTVFNSMLEKDHLSDLEYSKYAYINGKKATYFDRLTEEYIELDIDPVEHFYNKYGISVSNSEVNKEIMNEFKRQAFSAGQNGDFSVAGVAITATTPKEIVRTLDKLQEAKQQYEQSVRAEELRILQEKNELVKNELMLKKAMNTEDNQTNIAVAQIQAGAKIATANTSQPNSQPTLAK